MERIKFYSINDIACGYNLKNIEDLIKKYGKDNVGKEIQDINDIIELYNAKKYFDNEIYLAKWSDEDIKYYKNIINEYFGIVARFFKSINEDNIISLYNDVWRNYKDDFWELIDKFKVYKNINEEKFNEFMSVSEANLHEILKHKKITKHFGEVIRGYMLSDNLSAKLLLDKYEIKHTIKKAPLYLPEELTSEDKVTIINNYIDTENPNLNYLRLIANIQSNKDKIEISPKMLMKAKNKVEDKESQLFDEDSGVPMETAVIFSETQDEVVITDIKDNRINAKYSVKWIENNLDYATLLNNFIYLFEFVDLQMRCALVNKFNQMGVFERFALISSKNAYKTGIAFTQNNMFSLFQIKGYYNELFSLGIRLEEIVEWFFEEYLANEFNAYKFKVNMPSADSTILEKCTNIMPAMESVLKQFSLFVQEGEIDFELLQIRSQHLIYENIPSLIDRKYVYGIGAEYKTVTSLLFSDQRSLRYSEKTGKSYKNHFELLCNEKIKLKDYPDYYVSKVNWLLEHGYLSKNKKGYIVFNNKFLISILKDLYFNEVISYWRIPKVGRKIIDELEQKDIIEFESTLFSRPEEAYINYFLNKSQFNNGLDLRNKYVHTQPNINDENKHNQNYMIFLRLFILTVIKINDDFRVLEDIKNI